MLNKILEIGRKLEKDWQRENFPNSALTALQDLQIEGSIERFELEVQEWLRQTKLPDQLNLYNNFGEPSLTLFNNGQFAVDIYFWRKNDTLIHSHGFRGAFKILYGVSLHEDFEIEILDKFSADVLKTQLTQKSLCVMRPGDVRQIMPDIELTHRVVHLSDPTVSLCLRTVEDTNLNQWHHLNNGLSFQKKHISQKTIKQMLYFQYLLNSDATRAQALYADLLEGLDTASQISLYEGLCFDQMGLDPATSEIALEILQERFQKTPWFELYVKYFEDLEQHLNEDQAPTPELKLLAHAINNGLAKPQVSELLKHFSDQCFSDVCGRLLETRHMFTDGLEDLQIRTIKQYL